MKYKIRSKQLKRQVVEEALTGLSTPAVICRKYNISYSLLRNWKKQYAKGKFNNKPFAEVASQERIKELERMIGQLTMDNTFLKKALKHALSQQEQSEDLLETTYPVSEISEGGVEC